MCKTIANFHPEIVYADSWWIMQTEWHSISPSGLQSLSSSCPLSRFNVPIMQCINPDIAILFSANDAKCVSATKGDNWTEYSNWTFGGQCYKLNQIKLLYQSLPGWLHRWLHVGHTVIPNQTTYIISSFCFLQYSKHLLCTSKMYFIFFLNTWLWSKYHSHTYKRHSIKKHFLAHLSCLLSYEKIKLLRHNLMLVLLNFLNSPEISRSQSFEVAHSIPINTTMFLFCSH